MCLFGLLFAFQAAALEVPKLTGRVVDRAGVLDARSKAAIASRLEAYERETGHQFAVLTIPSLEGDSLEEFSIRVVEAWKLGREKKDDGLLLLVVTEDRKVRIEVGYGLEGNITDAFSSRVIRNILTPAFRRRAYAEGIDAALVALMRAESGQAPEGTGTVAAPPEKRRRGPNLFFLLFFVAPFLLPLVFGRRRGYYGGGFFIGGGGFGGGGFGGGGGGGFSGGGGGFGGGGASGSW